MERTGICIECGASFGFKGKRGPSPKRCETCKAKPRSEWTIDPLEAEVNRRSVQERWARYVRPVKPSPPPRFCTECGSVVMTKRATVCSKRCKNQRLMKSEAFKAAHARYQVSEKASLARERRRAKKAAAYIEDVDRQAIFERDGWTCQICQRPLDRTTKVPDLWAPTIDHIVPLARGGTHEPRNCQAAHFSCNARKGHRGGNEQLLLIG